MEREIIRLCGTSVELFTLNTVIVGSGAAGYQARFSWRRWGSGISPL